MYKNRRIVHAGNGLSVGFDDRFNALNVYGGFLFHANKRMALQVYRPTLTDEFIRQSINALKKGKIDSTGRPIRK